MLSFYITLTGADNLYVDLQLMIGYRPFIIWKYMWKFVTPTITAVRIYVLFSFLRFLYSLSYANVFYLGSITFYSVTSLLALVMYQAIKEGEGHRFTICCTNILFWLMLGHMEGNIAKFEHI